MDLPAYEVYALRYATVARRRGECFIFTDEPDAAMTMDELLHIGGHTAGLQAVRVHTARGWVVLASDAAHYWDNALLGSPFPLVHDVERMLEGHRRLQSLAESADHFIPGHDPQVLRRFARHGDAANDIVCLHESPLLPMDATASA